GFLCAGSKLAMTAPPVSWSVLKNIADSSTKAVDDPDQVRLSPTALGTQNAPVTGANVGPLCPPPELDSWFHGPGTAEVIAKLARGEGPPLPSPKMNQSHPWPAAQDPS